MSTASSQTTRLFFGTSLGMWTAVAISFALGRLPPDNCEPTNYSICWSSGIFGWWLPIVTILISVITIFSFRKSNWLIKHYPDIQYEDLDKNEINRDEGRAWAELELVMRQQDFLESEE